MDLGPADVEGRPGVMIHRDGEPAVFLTAAASKEGIHRVLRVGNPRGSAAFRVPRPAFPSYRCVQSGDQDRSSPCGGGLCCEPGPAGERCRFCRFQECSLSGLRTAQTWVTRRSAMSRLMTAATCWS